MTVTDPNSDDLQALEKRLEQLTGTTYEIAGCNRASTGFANTTWLLASSPEDLVIKVQSTPSVVFERDTAYEPAILAGLAPTTVPVPALVARDPDGTVFGSPWFAMKRVDGRCLPDVPERGYASEGWFAEAAPEYRTAIWNGFIDLLADLHGSPISCFGPEPRGGSHAQVLDYLEAGLRDGAGEIPVPNQERALGWLRDRAPREADALVTPCMGDARLANVLERDARITALVDWELAWLGNPCGDVGYQIYLDKRYAKAAGFRLTGLPDRDATWDRWQRRTGYDIADPDYWEVFGGIVMAVTATRAIVPMREAGLIPPELDIETINVFVQDLIEMIDAKPA